VFPMPMDLLAPMLGGVQKRVGPAQDA
jgi:hypothetical protein